MARIGKPVGAAVKGISAAVKRDWVVICGGGGGDGSARVVMEEPEGPKARMPAF